MELAPDVVIPLVFPDYLIAINTPPTKVDILPWIDFDNFVIPGTRNRVPELGHAGILLIEGSSGCTKYYEYGRYDEANLGLVRKLSVPDVVMKDNKPTFESLKKTLREIARQAGQGGRITAVYIEVSNKYEAMLKYAQLRQKQNSNPKRKPYSIMTNSCIHFTKEVSEKGGIETPWMIDPRPNSYIGEFRTVFPKLDYDYKMNAFTSDYSLSQ